MKKIFLFAAAALMFAAISCQKENIATEENITTEENAAISFDFNFGVPGADGTDTKAAKKGWVDGDKIDIWFDLNGYYPGATGPDLIFTYDGTNWNAGALRDGVTLYASGTVAALYEGYNGLSTYACYDSNPMILYRPVTKRYDLVDNYASAMNLMASAMNVFYTYSEGTVTADFSSAWGFRTMFKVLIKNDNGEMTKAADSYCLQVRTAGATPSYPESAGFIATYIYSGFTAVATNASTVARGCALGVQEADGIAFYYRSFSVAEQEVIFTLVDDTSPTVVGKQYNAGKKTLNATDATKCVGITLKYSKFVATP